MYQIRFETNAITMFNGYYRREILYLDLYKVLPESCEIYVTFYQV